MATTSRSNAPTGSGRFLTIDEIAQELSRRLARIFLRDENGRRSVFGDNDKLQTDPHFRDHEYFHGDTGRGVGAAHQTGWTGLIAKLLQPRRAERVVGTHGEPAGLEDLPRGLGDPVTVH